MSEMEVAVGSIRMSVTETARPTVTLRAEGDIDAEATEALRRALVDVIMRGRPERFVVDLGGVTKLDAVAIGAFQAADAAARDMNLTLIFHTKGSPVAARLDRHGIADSRTTSNTAA